LGEARTWLVPARTRLERVRRGIDAAARHRGIFHLYLHPGNLAESPQAFPTFEAIIEQLVRSRDAGDVEILTMSQVVDLMERQGEQNDVGAYANYAASH
jgi:hypothetical protein